MNVFSTSQDGNVYCACATIYREMDSKELEQFREGDNYKFSEDGIGTYLQPSDGQNTRSGAVYGAYNDKNDPDYTKRNKTGKELYEQVKNRKREFEISAVAKNSGFTYGEIDRVYKHLFERKHLFENGRIGFFDPDYYMMNSWLRIREGKKIFKHDLIMLHHELEEEKIMGDSLEIIYEKAHNKVQEEWNYQAALVEHLKDHDV